MGRVVGDNHQIITTVKVGFQYRVLPEQDLEEMLKSGCPGGRVKLGKGLTPQEICL